MGLVTAAVVGGAIAAAGTAYASHQQAKATKDATNASIQAAKDGRVDINALDQQTRDIATRNAVESRQLEQQLTPEVTSLRTDSIKSLAGDLAPSSESQGVRAGLTNDFNSSLSLPQLQRSGLLDDAIAKARGDLALGGKLDTDTQNMVTRRGLATAGGVATSGGLGLGRDVVARDLGLSSLDIANTRLGNATNLGKIDSDLSLTQQQLQNEINQSNLQRRLSVGSLLSDLGNQDFQKRLAISQFTQGIQQPIVGLDPGQAASVAIGNSNMMANAGQQAAGIRAAGANANAAIIGQGIGTIGGIASNYMANQYQQPAQTTGGYGRF